MADPYQVLGVERGASAEQIKIAYRKLAHQHHPDKGGDVAKFKEVNEAYQKVKDGKPPEPAPENIWENIRRRQNPFNQQSQPRHNPWMEEILKRKREQAEWFHGDWVHKEEPMTAVEIYKELARRQQALAADYTAKLKEINEWFNEAIRKSSQQ